MNKPMPIACHLHDYLEVACLFRYDVSILRKDGSSLAGQATTTLINSEKTEYLVITTDGHSIDIPVHEISRMTVVTPGARFHEVDFQR